MPLEYPIEQVVAHLAPRDHAQGGNRPPHVPGHQGQDVPDPYYSSAAGFELALDLIERAVVALGRA